jgi:hypothetical protein
MYLNIYGIILFCEQLYVVVGGFTKNSCFFPVLVFLLAFACLATPAYAERAAVVVDTGQNVQTACVSYSGSKTAEDILSSSGLGALFTDFGGNLGKAVCKIGATGCDPSNCFCSGNYWAFYYSFGGSWTESPTGVSFHQVSNGEVLGFSWTPFPPTEPAQRSFSEICSSSSGDSDARAIPVMRHFSVSLPNSTLCAGEPIEATVVSVEDKGPIWEASAEPSQVPGEFKRDLYYGASARVFQKNVWWNLVSAQEVNSSGTLELNAEKPGTYSLDVSKTGFVSVIRNFEIKDCTPVPECNVDADCADNAVCEQGVCVQLSGSCGYAENHKFMEYECCSDSACSALGSSARCEAHTCVVRSASDLGNILRVLFGYHIM